jgi:hypothetical protein
MKQERINDTVIEHRPISQLVSIVKNDFKKFDAERLIDQGSLVKTILYCNEKLGFPIKEIRETAIRVENYEAELPIDFDKLYYVTALKCTNGIDIEVSNPFDNNVDQDVIYEACLDRDSLACANHYMVTVKRNGKSVNYSEGEWTTLEVSSNEFCHPGCPNIKSRGKYQAYIKDNKINTPFKTGILYIIYIGLMRDVNGEVTFPFHPLITPYYEWSVKEKILQDAIFNSDVPNVGDMYKFAQSERVKAWIDAFNFTSEKDYATLIELQKKKELNWYNQWFKYFM